MTEKEKIPVTVEREYLKKYSAQELLKRIIQAHAEEEKNRREAL